MKDKQCEEEQIDEEDKENERDGRHIKPVKEDLMDEHF